MMPSQATSPKMFMNHFPIIAASSHSRARRRPRPTYPPFIIDPAPPNASTLDADSGSSIRIVVVVAQRPVEAYFTNDCAQGSTKVNANATLTTYMKGWISRALRLKSLISV
jgi:hypothetical protein